MTPGKKVGLDDLTMAGVGAEDLETFDREDVAAAPPAPPPGSLRAILLEAPQTDLGNAERFVAACRDFVRYDVPRQTWLAWDAQRWRPDSTGQVMRYAKRVMRRTQHIAVSQGDKPLLKHALASEARHRLVDLLALASTELPLVVTPDQLDADAWAFNVENVTLDTRTGTARPHDPADLITKVAPVTFDRTATCPRWEAFIAKIMGDDMALIRYLQRIAGCALVGLGGLKTLFVFYGDGDNGKTTFVNVLLALLGPYGKTADAKTFLTVSDHLGGHQHRDDLAQFPGVRFVAAGEPPKAAKLDAALIKKLTGGDPVTCRAAYGRTFTFDPVCKLVLSTNEKPEITEHTAAIWDRITPVPFLVTIPKTEIIKNYHLTLIKELPGILNWALTGCLAWHREGLGEPAAVSQAREAYRNEMDGLEDWLAAETVADHVAWTPTAVLYRAYSNWCLRKHIASPLTSKQFGRRLPTKRNVIKRDTTRSRGWTGIRLANDMFHPVSESFSGNISRGETLGNDALNVTNVTNGDLTSDIFDPPEPELKP